MPTAPELIGLYLADLAASSDENPTLLPNYIKRRLFDLCWNCVARGQPLDHKDRHIKNVLDGIKRKHAWPPVKKEAITSDDIKSMVATPPFDLRGLRDRAILLIGAMPVVAVASKA